MVRVSSRTWPTQPNHPLRQILAGLGVPDIRGTFGTFSFYTTESLPAQVQQNVVAEIDKDLTSYDAGQLTDWLRKAVWEK